MREALYLSYLFILSVGEILEMYEKQLEKFCGIPEELTGEKNSKLFLYGIFY